MQFTDFKMKDLLHQPVLWSMDERKKVISKISQVAKIGFQIVADETRWFSYYTGRELEISKNIGIKGLGKCELIDSEDIEAIQNQINNSEQKLSLVDLIVINKKELIRLDLADLEYIKNKLQLQ